MEQIPSENILLLKELSDIKEKLATNTEATKNTGLTLAEIKQDLKVFQNSFVTHEEFEAQNTDKEGRIRNLEQFRWQFAGGMSVLVFASDLILYFLLRK